MTTEGFKDAVEAQGEGINVGVILDQTNFYAEQGGQIYDTGGLPVDAGTRGKSRTPA